MGGSERGASVGDGTARRPLAVRPSVGVEVLAARPSVASGSALHGASFVPRPSARPGPFLRPLAGPGLPVAPVERPLAPPWRLRRADGGAEGVAPSQSRGLMAMVQRTPRARPERRRKLWAPSPASHQEAPWRSLASPAAGADGRAARAKRSRHKVRDEARRRDRGGHVHSAAVHAAGASVEQGQPSCGARGSSRPAPSARGPLVVRRAPLLWPIGARRAPLSAYLPV